MSFEIWPIDSPSSMYFCWRKDLSLYAGMTENGIDLLSCVDGELIRVGSSVSRHFRTPRGDIKTLKFIKKPCSREAFLFWAGFEWQNRISKVLWLYSFASGRLHELV